MTARRRIPCFDPPDVRRIARQSLAEAIALLEAPPLSDHAVHAVRKNLKRARAMLRMMRAGLGEEDYRNDNAVLRDAAHGLGAARDSKVLLDTLKGLPERGVGSALQVRLRREHAQSRDELRGGGSTVKQASNALRTVRRRLAEEPADRYDWPVVERGVREVYARARATLECIQAHPSPENLHELRKQTKYLWHQLEALATARARSLGALAAATHHLSDLLGDDHNLTVLSGKVADTPMAPGARKRLLARIDARHDRLVARALRLARRIYREPPAAFAARVGRRGLRS